MTLANEAIWRELQQLRPLRHKLNRHEFARRSRAFGNTAFRTQLAFAASCAELFTVESDDAYPVPDGLDLSVAEPIQVEFGTAQDGLFESGRLNPGRNDTDSGAAGGVGIAAVQLAHRAGATVIAVAATRERLEHIAALGADYLIDYQTRRGRESEGAN